MRRIKHEPNRFGTIFLINIAGALLTSMIYVYVDGIWLLPTDGAYGIGFFRSLQDPFVMGTALFAALIVGIVSSPILYYLLRHKNLMIVYPVLQTIVVVEIIAVMPFNGGLALIGACLALWIGSLVVWLTSFAEKKGSDHSPQLGNK